jgi:mRNA-degrading endonuclease HigB of HigAB toxin-antitoxin module
MATKRILTADKTGLVAKKVHENQYWDDDYNEQKEVANNNADEIDSNKTEIDSLTIGQTGGLISFTTKSILDAHTDAGNNDSYKVTNDPDSSKNGYYHWDGVSAYIKDASLVVSSLDNTINVDAIGGKAISDYVDGNLAIGYYDTESFYIDKTTGVKTTFAVAGYAVTGYLKIVKDKIIFNARGSDGATATIAFYDEDKIFISSLSGATLYDNKTTTLLRSEMPSNTVYIRSTGYFESSWIYFKDLYTLNNDLQDKITLRSGSQFHKNTGSFINTTGGLTPNPNYNYTDYLEIDVKNGFHVFGRSSAQASLVAFYDVDKIFISSINEDNKDSVDVFVDIIEIPVNAIYVRCTGWIGKYNYVTAPTLSSISLDLNDKITNVDENLTNVNIDLSIGYYNQDSFFINKNTGNKTASIAGFSVTDFLKLGRDKIIFNARGSDGDAATIAFYDINKIFISSLSGAATYDNKTITLLRSEMPVDTEYIRSTGHFESSWIYFDNLYSLRNDINNLVNDSWTNKGKYVFGENMLLNKTTPVQSGMPTEVLLLTDLYIKYDSLVTTYPNYVTKIDCDAAMLIDGIPKPAYLSGLDTFLYQFRPTYAPNGVNHTGDQNYNELKIFITTGTHPEFVAMDALYNQMKFICDTWNTDQNAEEFRYNVTFYIIPSSNLSGNDAQERANDNGVDLNRNLPTNNWFESGTPGFDYSGAVAGSEYETKILIKYLEELTPNVYIDFHNFGIDFVGNLFYIQSSSQLGTDIDANLISEITRKFKNIDSNIAQDTETMVGWVASEIEGSRTLYAHEKGMLSFLYETALGSSWLNGVNTGSTQRAFSSSLHITQAMQGFNMFLLKVLKTYSETVKAKDFNTI